MTPSLFKTPQEAIAACDAECLVAWVKFAAINHIKPEIDQVAYDITKKVFMAGFVTGASFVTGYIIRNINPPNNPPNDPLL